ncbi:MAG: phage tail protein [Ruminococcus sp.]|nr:phage tail protein [Ruminococcus sp.]
MAFYHGISTRQAATSLSTPVTAASGVTFVVGTAPVHILGADSADGKNAYKNVNAPIMCSNYNEAVSALGFSDDWEKYTLCEVIYNHFQLYATSPVFFVNVLDPAKHKISAAAETYQVIDGKAKLPFDTIAESVKIESYKRGEDFDLLYDGDTLVVEILDGGVIPAGTSGLSIEFDKVDPSQITKADIIGGFDVNTKKTSGFELIEAVFPKYGIAPDILICPKWSSDSEVAAIMATKAANINGVFQAKALIDVDTAEVKHYADVTAWKKAKNINDKAQALCFPMCKLGDRIFHLSVQMAGLMATVDTDNGGCPAESPSNKLLKIDSAVLADGTEVLLDLTQANYLNSNGITTALNFIGGFVLWGNETACYPANTDVKDYFLCVSRMFGWVSNSLVLTYWGKIDSKFNRRLIDSIIDSVNIWLNGLTAEEKLLGGRVEFIEDENPDTALMSGKAVFHIFLTPPSPAKEMEFVLEYDTSYVTSALLA